MFTRDSLFPVVSHSHGNISSVGTLGGSSGVPLITTTDGLITDGSFGTAPGTFCQGSDSRLSDARQCNNSFVNAATSRSNLGLGNHVTHNYGTTAGSVCQGNDVRFASIQETAARSSAYTLTLSDAGMVVLMSAAGAVNVTVPTHASVSFSTGTIINIYNTSSALVTVVGASGVTVRNAGAIGQYGEISLRKRATNEWVLAGEVS